MAASRVFAVPELLESILLLISPRELLLSQRTSTAFRKTIEGSSKLLHVLNMRTKPQLFDYTPEQVQCDSQSLLLNNSFAVPDVQNYECYPAANGAAAILYIEDPSMSFIEETLVEDRASWLNMYLQKTATPLQLQITFKLQIELQQLVDWHSVNVALDVPASTMRELLELVSSAHEAAKQYARVQVALTPGMDDDFREACDKSESTFRWRKYFSQKQLVWMIGKPEFHML